MKKVLFASLLMTLLVLPGFAAEQLAEVENLGDTLVFHPTMEFAQLVLTVTGPCDFQYRQVVTKGEPFFRLDETTIDGRYTYNLFREEPIDPGIVEVLKEARQAFDEETPKQLCRDGKLPGPPLVQSEGFGVLRGEILYDPESFEKSSSDRDLSVKDVEDLASAAGMSMQTSGPRLTTKDFVINDDLIVDGSACIGFDCVNGESFGFDTIRLKENNLRIKFDDTSTAASFPRNDWQLTANDSANGGASKFSIDDISGNRTPFTVEANARSHSLYVDDGGRIGSRTSTPSVEIHTIDGDTPTLRLQQDGSSGFAPQTWDVAGNETNFFVRDVTNGSTLPFRIRPGAPSSAIFIDVSGDVGMGTSSPGDDLHVLATDATDTTLRIENSNAAAQIVAVEMLNTAAAASAGWQFRLAPNGNFLITRNSSGDTELLISASDGSVTMDSNLNVGGDLNVTGTKNFAVADPEDSTKWLYFSALEGPEAGTYYRGTARTVEGQAVIELPETFSKLTEVEGITVQLTPQGGWHQLYVAEKSPEKLVVRDAEGSDGVEFDFFVQGVRRGYSDFKVERPAPQAE